MHLVKNFNCFWPHGTTSISTFLAYSITFSFIQLDTFLLHFLHWSFCTTDYWGILAYVTRLPLTLAWVGFWPGSGHVHVEVLWFTGVTSLLLMTEREKEGNFDSVSVSHPVYSLHGGVLSFTETLNPLSRKQEHASSAFLNLNNIIDHLSYYH